MRQILILSALLTLSFGAYAQEENEEYELRGNEKYGYVITNDDQRIDGIVKLVGNASNPWMNQKKVKFVAKNDIDPSKKRQKFSKMDATDIKEYVATDEDGKDRHFRKIKFTNTREGSSSSSGVGGKIKTLKNLTSTTHLAEVLVDGKITMYKLYAYPTMVSVGNDDVEKSKQEEENVRTHPDILVQKEDDKVRELAVSDIKDLVDDCKTVSDKLAAAGFKTYDPAKEEKKKSGFGKLIKGEVDRGGSKLTDMGTEIFSEYNVTCK